jgi:hypothetical protein
MSLTRCSTNAKWLTICNELSWRTGRISQPADHLYGLAAGSQRVHAPDPVSGCGVNKSAK